MTEPTPKPVSAERPRPVPEKRGIECPACGCRHFHVLYTRRAVGKRILRRRECRHCGRRITTCETALRRFDSPQADSHAVCVSAVVPGRSWMAGPGPDFPGSVTR